MANSIFLRPSSSLWCSDGPKEERHRSNCGAFQLHALTRRSLRCLRQAKCLFRRLSASVGSWLHDKLPNSFMSVREGEIANLSGSNSTRFISGSGCAECPLTARTAHGRTHPSHCKRYCCSRCVYRLFCSSVIWSRLGTIIS